MDAITFRPDHWMADQWPICLKIALFPFDFGRKVSIAVGRGRKFRGNRSAPTGLVRVGALGGDGTFAVTT